MPMTPTGIVDKEQSVELTPPKTAEVTENSEHPPENDDGFWCLREDGTIDNKAQTNKTAADVSCLLGAPIDVEDPCFCAGIILLTGRWVGFKHKEISNFTGLPRGFCDKVCYNLRINRLVREGDIVGELRDEAQKGEEADGVMAQITFVLYCLAGIGNVVVRYDRRGETSWLTTPATEQYIYHIDAVA